MKLLLRRTPFVELLSLRRYQRLIKIEYLALLREIPGVNRGLPARGVADDFSVNLADLLVGEGNIVLNQPSHSVFFLLEGKLHLPAVRRLVNELRVVLKMAELCDGRAAGACRENDALVCGAAPWISVESAWSEF